MRPAVMDKDRNRREHPFGQRGQIMQLIGMLDSPYVRRVAISLKVLGLAFDLDQVSVFRQFEKFSSINPVVKAPSFVTDDGVVLMDSNLILEHIAHLAPRSLMPADRAAHEIALRQMGLALAACEKTVSILYERNQRPAEKHHQPWLDRILGQLLLAYGALEREVSPDWLPAKR
jgi:glutathione S-transferase